MSNIQFKQTVDFNKNTAKNMGLERLSIAPANPKTNQIYVDTSENLIKQYDGTKWVVLGVSGAMIYKGTVGTGGTVTTLPTDPDTVSTGDTYMVCADGTYGTQKAVIGDLFIAKKDTSASPATITWTYVPSGNDKFIYEIVGDDTTSIFEITHTLNTSEVNICMYDETNGESVIAGFERVDANKIKVSFVDAVPTGTNYKVVILA